MRLKYFRALTRLLAFGLLLAGLPGCGVNKIPTLDEQVKAAWSEVLNQYQRRADLIPNLVETVKGYAHQEQQVLTQVTEARAHATQMQLPADILSNPQAFHQFEQNQAAIGGALGRLLAVAEAYPDLKSNQNFLALQSQLEGTENRIAVARRDYILAVQNYNTILRTIPGRWVAAIIYPDMKVRETFTIYRAKPAGATGQILMRIRCAWADRGAGAGWALLILLLILASPALASEPKFPPLTGRVVDDAGVLNAYTAERTHRHAGRARARNRRASRSRHAQVAPGISHRGLRLSARPPLGHRAERHEHRRAAYRCAQRA